MMTPGFWYRPPGLAARALAPVGQLYGLAGRARFAIAKPAEAGIPVVCVGNLVAGGAGKTPVALALAERLGTCRVHFVTRGHGGNEAGPLRVDLARHRAPEVGDEALLLARARTTWVARDRVAGARAAAEAGAELAMLDDGFQNPALRKDLSVVVVDGEAGFGNGRLVPAGPLREPVERGLARAQAVVILGEDRAGVRALVEGRLPVLGARLEPAPGMADLRGVRAVAFAGIGRPEKFFETCRRLGVDLRGTVPFPDHHPYAVADLSLLERMSKDVGAVLLTTEKDWVRLPAAMAPQVQFLPVRVRWDEPEAADRLLDLLSDSAGAAHGQ